MRFIRNLHVTSISGRRLGPLFVVRSVAAAAVMRHITHILRWNIAPDFALGTREEGKGLLADLPPWRKGQIWFFWMICVANFVPSHFLMDKTMLSRVLRLRDKAAARFLIFLNQGAIASLCSNLQILFGQWILSLGPIFEHPSIVIDFKSGALFPFLARLHFLLDFTFCLAATAKLAPGNGFRWRHN